MCIYSYLLVQININPNDLPLQGRPGINGYKGEKGETSTGGGYSYPVSSSPHEVFLTRKCIDINVSMDAAGCLIIGGISAISQLPNVEYIWMTSDGLKH